MVKQTDVVESARKVSHKKKDWIILCKDKGNKKVYCLYEPTFETDPLRSKKPFRTLLGLNEPAGAWKLYFMPPSMAKLKEMIGWAVEELQRQTSFRDVQKPKGLGGFKKKLEALGQFSDQDEDVREAFLRLGKVQGDHLIEVVKLGYPEAKGKVKGGLFLVETVRKSAKKEAA